MTTIDSTSKYESEEQTPVEQLNMLLKQSFAAFATTIALLLFILYWIHTFVDTNSLYRWTAAIVVLNIYLLIWVYFVRRDSKIKQITAHKAKRFILIYQIQALLHGLTWGLLPFLFIEPTSEMKFFAYIILCGLAAGAIGTTAMIYRIYLSFMLPLMLPTLLTQLFFYDDFKLFGRSTLGLLIIFVVSLIVLSHSHYDSIKRSIALMLENKHLLSKVTIALGKAEAASEAKSNFLANMSHELRTPLNAIIGYSDIIKDSFADNKLDTIPADADRVLNAGQHLLTLINNILDLSKVEAGKMEVLVEDVNISHLLTEIKDTTETLIKKNKNNLIIDSPHNFAIIRSDITKLRQIFLNIISNAAKFTDNGNITIKVVTGKENIKISISDTGIGMNEKQLIDLKTPFTQADISTTKIYGGSGLGMSLTYLLTQMLGIQLDVTSELNKGSCFTLTIPLEYKPEIKRDDLTV